MGNLRNKYLLLQLAQTDYDLRDFGRGLGTESARPMTPAFHHIIAALCLLLLLQTVALPQSNSFNVRYLGGSLETKTGKDDWHNNLVILSDEIRVELKDGQR